MGFEEEIENKKSILNFNSDEWFVECPVEKKTKPASVVQNNIPQKVNVDRNRRKPPVVPPVTPTGGGNPVSRTSVGNTTTNSTSAAYTPPPPPPPKKKSKAPVIIAIIAVTLVVLVGVGIFGVTKIIQGFTQENTTESVTENITDETEPQTEVVTEETTAPLQNGSTVVFGSYPQTIVKDSQLIAQFSAISANNWQSYSYYSGDGNAESLYESPYMEFCDVFYAGNTYRGVRFSQYRPYFSHIESNSDNSMQDDHGYYPHYEYWFKYEPLTWTVLNAESGILVCDKIIDAQPFRNLYCPSNGIAYSDYSYTKYANDYFSSDIYYWLNNDFFYTAFSYTERSYIYDDVTIPKDYDYSYDLGQKGGSDYAKCQGLWYTPDGPSVMTWTTGMESNLICAVNRHFDGAHSLDYEKATFDTTTGICPIILVNDLNQVY